MASNDERAGTSSQTHTAEDDSEMAARSFMYCCGTLHVLFADRAFCDVTFCCNDGVQVYAHKFILATRAEHFKNQLYARGDMLEQNCKHKTYAYRTASHVLNQILEYLYTGVIAELEVETTIAEDRVQLWKTLLAEAQSKKLGDLDTYLKLLLVRRQILDYSTAAAFFTFAIENGLEEVSDAMAWVMLQLPFKEDSLKDLGDEVLRAVLESIPLEATELQVIKAVSVWAQENLMSEEPMPADILDCLDLSFVRAVDIFDEVEQLKLFNQEALLTAYETVVLNCVEVTCKNSKRGAGTRWHDIGARWHTITSSVGLDDDAMFQAMRRHGLTASAPAPLHEHAMVQAMRRLQGLAICSDASNPAASMSPARFVLVGATGGGKSTTANVLLGDSGAKKFRVSNQLYSCTTRLEEQEGSGLGRKWTVVDTPGLGDRSQLIDDKGNLVVGHEAVMKRDGNSQWYFETVSAHLHEHGGTMLYVQRCHCFTEPTRNHTRALNMIMNESFGTGVILVLTHLPSEVVAFVGDAQEVIDRKCGQEGRPGEYDVWLGMYRKVVEHTLGVRFAGTLGLCDLNGVVPQHPAHPTKFMEALLHADGEGRGCFVPPRATRRWSTAVASATVDPKVWPGDPSVVIALQQTIAAIELVKARIARLTEWENAVEPVADMATGATTGAVPTLGAILATVAIPTLGATEGLARFAMGGLQSSKAALRYRIVVNTQKLVDLETVLAEQALAHFDPAAVGQLVSARMYA